MPGFNLPSLATAPEDVTCNNKINNYLCATIKKNLGDLISNSKIKDY